MQRDLDQFHPGEIDQVRLYGDAQELAVILWSPDQNGILGRCSLRDVLYLPVLELNGARIGDFAEAVINHREGPVDERL